MLKEGFMKWSILCGLAVCCLASTICGVNLPEKEKLYVKMDQVIVKEDSILINLSGNLYPVTGLYKDSQGLHVMAKEVVDDHTFSWTCPLGHSSPDGSGMCRRPQCPFEKKS